MAEAQAAIAFSVDRHAEQFGKAWKPAALPQPSDLAVAPTKGSPGMQTLRPLRVLLLSVPILLTPWLDIAPWMICLVSVWILLEAEPCAVLLCSLPRKTRKASTGSTLNQTRSIMPSYACRNCGRSARTLQVAPTDQEPVEYRARAVPLD